MAFNANYIYVVAQDNSASGDYRVIDGVALMAKGSDQLGSYEDPATTAKQLKAALTVGGQTPKIAIVTATVENDGGLTGEQIAEIF